MKPIAQSEVTPPLGIDGNAIYKSMRMLAQEYASRFIFEGGPDVPESMLAEKPVEEGEPKLIAK